ncbi:galactosyltransferase-related protein [Fulvimarina sp. 2208YS6-2-32]|uniref:Galactosyltransferase-related protein n=1 Tax=Fulvimarina uroteuthidis TaxID=3098149 RepID=A0ABU5HZG7_9HYPH|nr:galactosyltransferase-related protein [Fulvimarina sp. 2208YS6-2-32]MDY8108153.1 galactosyltransferase-related protein [Fulvimarina sp. 2208YS6-2-32]
MTVSVLTLTRNRRAHLLNLMESLRLQTERPDELVIACMQEAVEPDLPDIGIPVRQFLVPGERLPLARARNRAAARANGETLVFLDVDCIASPPLVARFEAAARGGAGLFLGEVRYLPGGAVGRPLDFEALHACGIVHPSKPPMPQTGLREEPDTGEFWGLSFAISAASWTQLGGMDESFVGYGGEETDLAARLKPAGLPLFWTAGAVAYHQHHAVHVPPLPHFHAIIANARRFHAKHGRWCMDYWLGQFAGMGLIAWTPAAPDIVVERDPTGAEIAAARQPDSVRFS